MNCEPTQSERLLEEVRKEIKRRRTTLHKVSLEMGCNYITLYYIFNPKRRAIQRAGKPRFSYEIGKKLEQWLQNNRAK